jgi:hypothetical protein
MNRASAPLFLERETYRRRRLADAARILPIAGLIAVLLPALWSRAPGQGAAAPALNTAQEAVYLFVLWGVLVVAAALLTRALTAQSPVRRSTAIPANTLNPAPALPAAQPDTAQPDTAQPDTAQPDTAQPETAQPAPPGARR